MPGPPKTNLRNTATAVLTKTQGKAVRAALPRIASTVPQIADTPEFREYLTQLVRELQNLRTEVQTLQARLDSFIVDPGTGVVTFPI